MLFCDIKTSTNYKIFSPILIASASMNAELKVASRQMDGHKHTDRQIRKYDAIIRCFWLGNLQMRITGNARD